MCGGGRGGRGEGAGITCHDTFLHKFSFLEIFVYSVELRAIADGLARQKKALNPNT